MGALRWTHANGDTCSGNYVELVPHRRIVFTYGWERLLATEDAEALA